jgi:hypothetical protein
MSGGYSIVVAGTVITASRENQYVSRQVVTRFATDAARTSAISTDAEEGMLSYNEDTDLYKSYEAAGWRQLPGQLIRRGNRASSSSTTTTTEIGVLRVDDIPIVSGVVYLISTSPVYLLGNTNDTISLRVRVSTTGAAATTDTQVGNALQLKTDAGQPPSAVFSSHYTAGTTGNLSMLVTVQRTSGSGNAQTFGSFDLYISAFALADPGDSGIDI